MDQAIFEANIEALMRWQAHISPQDLAVLEQSPSAGGFEVVDGRRGLPTLRFTDPSGGVKHVHSLFDPAREADKRAAALRSEDRDVYVLCGLGLGYGAMAMIKRLPLPACMVIFEPFVQALALAMGAVDLTPLLSHPRVMLIPGTDLPHYRNHAIDFLGNFSAGSIAVESAPHTDMLSDFYSNVNALFSEILPLCANLKDTREKFHALNQENAAHNIWVLLRHAALDALAGLYRGTPAVIVGPGTGLLKVLPWLSAAREKCLIISLNSAADYLVKNGVVPHFITAIDPQEFTLKSAGSELPPECRWLVADFTNKSLVAEYEQSMYVYPAGLPTQHALAAGGVHAPALVPGPSAATAALRIASLFQCDPIAFCGLDFQYVEGRRYAWDDPYVGCRTYEQGDNIWGVPTQTTAELKAYAAEFSDCVRQISARIVDIRETGLAVQGAETVTCRDFLINLTNHPLKNPLERFNKAVREQNPARIATRKHFMAECRNDYHTILGIVQELLSEFRDLSQGSTMSVDKAISWFQKIEVLSARPIWHLLRGHFYPLHVTVHDIETAADPKEIGVIISELIEYFESSLELLQSVEKAFT